MTNYVVKTTNYDKAIRKGGFLLYCFPRKEYLEVSTVFALLFRILIAAVIVCTALAVRNGRKPSRGKLLKKNKAFDF